MRRDRGPRQTRGDEPLSPIRRRAGVPVDELVNSDDFAGPESVSELVPGEACLHELVTREGAMLGFARLR